MLGCVTKISLTAFMWGLTALPFCPRLSFVLPTGFGWHTMFGVSMFSIVMPSLPFLTSSGLKSVFCFSLDIRTGTSLGIPFPYFTWDSDFLLRRRALLGGDEEISFFNTFWVSLSFCQWTETIHVQGHSWKLGTDSCHFYWFYVWGVTVLSCLNHSSMAYYFLWTHRYVCLSSAWRIL